MTIDPRSSIRRLALSRAISIGGGAAAFMALNVVIFEKTHSAKWLAMTMLFTFGAEGLMSPLGGLVADRFDRRWVMIWSDLLGAALFFALAFIHDPIALIAVAFFAAAVETPFWSASSAAIPNISEPDRLDRANAWLAASRNFGIMAGPLIGGLMVSSVGAQWVFLFNAITFVFSAWLVYSVRAPFQEERGEHEEHDRGLKVGFDFLIHDRVLLTITLAWMALVLGMGAVMVADLPLVVQSFGQDKSAYGILIALWGGGSILGTLCGRWLKPGREAMFLFAGTCGIALCTGFVALAPWFSVAVTLICFAGIADAMTLVAEEGLRQRRTPDAIRSRVIAVSSTGWQTIFAVSFVFGGFAVNWLGPRGVYAFSGVMAGVAALILVPVFRVLREEREATSTANKEG